jgi:hypothetical protein
MKSIMEGAKGTTTSTGFSDSWKSFHAWAFFGSNPSKIPAFCSAIILPTALV